MYSENFGVCPCGGIYDAKSVEIRRGVTVLEDVPQGACPTCGSRVYRADTLERIEVLVFSGGTDPATQRFANPVHSAS